MTTEAERTRRLRTLPSLPKVVGEFLTAWGQWHDGDASSYERLVDSLDDMKAALDRHRRRHDTAVVNARATRAARRRYLS